MQTIHPSTIRDSSRIRSECQIIRKKSGMIVPLSTPFEDAILLPSYQSPFFIPEEIVDQIPIDASSLSIPVFFQFQEEERYRVARALMRGPGQILANTLVELEHCIPLIGSDPSAAEEGISALREEIRSGFEELKSLVAELQPPLLDEMGLGPSLKKYAENLQARNNIEIDCAGCESVSDRLPFTMETAIFRIVQEALGNVLAHSGATVATVQIARIANQVCVEVSDNGRGFNAKEGARAKPRQLGLIGMYDRASLIGGQLQIYSQVRKGTRVVLKVPYHIHEEDIRASGGRHEDGREIEPGRKKSISTFSHKSRRSKGGQARAKAT